MIKVIIHNTLFNNDLQPGISQGVFHSAWPAGREQRVLSTASTWDAVTSAWERPSNHHCTPPTTSGAQSTKSCEETRKEANIAVFSKLFYRNCTNWQHKRATVFYINTVIIYSIDYMTTCVYNTHISFVNQQWQFSILNIKG